MLNLEAIQEQDTMAVILEHTRLAREWSELPNNAESPKAYAPIAKRKQEIKERISQLREIERSWKQ